MKAYELRKSGGADAWVQVERDAPKAGPGQALVRMRAVSLNYRDLLIAKGGYLQPVTQPVIPVSDGAGEVVAVGEGVTRVKVGDRVTPTFFQTWTDGEVTWAQLGDRALGAGSTDRVLAELVALDAEGLVPLPEPMSFEEGATLPGAAVTVWNALVPQGNLQAGQSVLVQGTGGVSIFALQLAHALGARVIVTSSQDEKVRVRGGAAGDAVPGVGGALREGGDPRLNDPSEGSCRAVRSVPPSPPIAPTNPSDRSGGPLRWIRRIPPQRSCRPIRSVPRTLPIGPADPPHGSRVPHPSGLANPPDRYRGPLRWIGLTPPDRSR